MTTEPCDVDADCSAEAHEVCLESECRVRYDVLADDFCTITYTSRYYEADGVVYLEDDAYVIEMGETIPYDELPENMQYVTDELAMGRPAHYCHFRYRVEARPLDSFSEHDAQILRSTLLEPASGFCTNTVPPFELEQVAMRTTNPGIVVLEDPRDETPPGAEPAGYFRGYFGVPETGTATRVDSGATLGAGYFRHCTPTPGGGGPGICPAVCRQHGPGAGLPACRFEHIMALPADPCLIDRAWVMNHRYLFERIHDAECLY
ncbi:MAG: hypothetical protein KF901_15000 [Myxococcales bacterium]|nr:hypothetical protein [Myxococcales bacterium]